MNARRDPALLHHYDAVPGIPRGETGTVRTRDGLTLLTRRWVARDAEGRESAPWARVLLLHGLSEHSGRYEHVGGWLSREGLEVHAYDQRGWGASDGYRGHVGRWSQYSDDLGERIAALAAEAPRLPLAVYGHSFGGLVVLGYLLDEHRAAGTAGGPLPDLAILSGVALATTYPGWLFVLARVAGAVVPRLRPPMPAAGGGAVLSRDPEVARRFATDPLLAHPTTGFGRQGLLAQARIARALDRLDATGRTLPVPTLVLHGTDDGRVPFASTERLARFDSVTHRPFPGLRHELHNEPEGEAVVAGIAEWIRERMRGSAG